MAAANRQHNTSRGDADASGRDPEWGLASAKTRGLVLPVVLGIGSAIGLLLSYLEIGPTSFRIAIFSCIIAGFVAALFQRRSLAQAEQVVAEERQARLAAARDLREEMAALRDAVQGARGPAVDVGPLRAELASLAGKVSALEQSQSAFRDSLVQEMNPGRGRRRGRAGDVAAAANGSSYPPAYGTPSYTDEAPEPQPYEAPYEAPTHEPALARRSWSGADAVPSAATDEPDAAEYGSTEYSAYDTLDSPAASSESAERRLAEIFTAPDRGRDAGTGRPSWSTGAGGVENGSANATNGGGRSPDSNPYSDAFAAYAGENAFESSPDEQPDSTSPARSALWESSAASRLANAAGARPAPGDRSGATAWEPEGGEQRGRTPWSEAAQLGDDEDPVAAAARHGSPRRGRPSDEDPHETTLTQRLSASEQTAIRRRFLDLSSMEDDGWSRRR
jgi:hypothetical protein